VVDGPTAADGRVPDDCRGDDWSEGDAMEAGVRAVWCRGSPAAGVPVDERVLGLQASYVQALDVGRFVADARRVADVRHCLCPVLAPALPRVVRPAQAWLAPAAPADDLVHATLTAAPQ
jgi:hypothetical protein